MSEVEFTCDCGERHRSATEDYELDDRFTCSCGRMVVLTASVVSLPSKTDGPDIQR